MKVLLKLPLAFAYLPVACAAAGSIPCDVADVLAEKAYKRVSEAMSNHQRAVAIGASQAFWDIHEHASLCPKVASRAADLVASGFHENLLDLQSVAVLEEVNRNSVAGLLAAPEPKILSRKTSQGSGGFSGSYAPPTALNFGPADKQADCSWISRRTRVGGYAITNGITIPRFDRMLGGASIILMNNSFRDEDSASLVGVGVSEKPEVLNPTQSLGSKANALGVGAGNAGFRVYEPLNVETRSVLDAAAAISGNRASLLSK